MALVLNDEQIMLRESARDFLHGRAPVSHLRSLRDDAVADGFSRELWGEIAEMGWSAILVPEEYGGLDYGYTGLGVVLEECGRTLTPSPLAGTALAAVTALRLTATPDQCAKYLPGIAAGERIVALACDENSLHQPEEIEAVARASGGGFCLNGSKIAVTDGQAADAFIVSAVTPEGMSLFLVASDAAGVSVERYPVLDTHAAARVTLENVEVGPDGLLGEAGGGPAVLEQVLDAARIGAAAELLGLASEAFERTLEYLRERKQFGVPIGSFQALQHRAAQLHSEIELGKSVVLKALQALDSGEDCRELASLAKAKLSATAHRAATEAIQMHGGIGMTDEHDIGFFLKRCRILETRYGDRYYHLDRYAALRGY